MNSTERQFLAKVWFAVAGVVCWSSLTALYGCFVPGTKLSFPIFGDLTFTERAVIGIPILFAGYSIAFVLGIVVLRKANGIPFPGAGDGGFTRGFLKTSFYFIMFVPVLTLFWLQFGGLHRLNILEMEGTHRVLRGWQIYALQPGPWEARGISTLSDGDSSRLSFSPGVVPRVYSLLNLLALASFCALPFLIRANRSRRPERPSLERPQASLSQTRLRKGIRRGNQITQ